MPENGDLRELRARALEGELQRTQDVIRLIMESWHRLMALSALVLGTGLTLGIGDGTGNASYDSPAIVIGLPLPLLLIALYASRLLVEQLVQGGYKRHLEYKLNELLRDEICQWERRLVPEVIDRARSNIMLPVANLLIFLASIAFSFHAAMIDPPLPIWLLVVLYLVGVAAVGMGLLDARHAREDAYAVARRASGCDEGTEAGR